MTSRRWLLIAVTVAMLVPGVAIASHQFDDVPNSHVFHTSIDWLADNAITVGCNPPTNDMFCPDRGVTRGEMATFLKRFHDRFITAGGTPLGLGIGGRLSSQTPHAGSGVVSGMSLSLTIPVAGVLVVTASADTSNELDPDAFLCGINTGGDVNLARGDSWRVIDLTVGFYDTCATQTAFEVSPGNVVARLILSEAEPTTEVYGGNIAAILYPDAGSFGLLGTADEQEAARPLSDEPKQK